MNAADSLRYDLATVLTREGIDCRVTYDPERRAFSVELTPAGAARLGELLGEKLDA